LAGHERHFGSPNIDLQGSFATEILANVFWRGQFVVCDPSFTMFQSTNDILKAREQHFVSARDNSQLARTGFGVRPKLVFERGNNMVRSLMSTSIERDL
jgi:hypothetical protein